ncbi:hypothetical protein OB962_06065 [Aeromonas piscicola]|uniref:Fimbrial protein n=1 Tax=Aeromonas piscicola TaxID=600645 RepID=A0ABT7Q9Y3_9GAMM|nr:hypothetical protein [Aeromonas piscicola]MDM5130568.1 hypothetical protein [Aeromonas piscicola]
MIKIIFLITMLIPFSFAQAVVIKVNAEYAQSLKNPSENEFRITDPCKPLPLSVFCNDNLSRVISIDSDIDRPLVKGGTWWERLFYHSFPGEKLIQLFNENGSPASMKFSMTHTGYSIDNPFFQVTNESLQADSNAKCKLVDNMLSVTGDRTDTIFYAIDLSAQKTGGVCYSGDFSLWSGHPTPRVGKIRRFYLGYKITPVNIGTISNGTYKGKLSLSVGSTRDIDFTNSTYRSPTVVDLEFSLVVRNQLKVVFPPTGSKVILQPDGVWRHGDKTPSLSGVMPVQITSSIPYWIKLECQYLSTIDDSCQIKSDKNASLVSMSIYKKSAKGNVLLSPTLKKIFEKNEPISNGLFSFKINKDKVKDMMNYPGSTYKGNVTIIMDAMIEPVYN